MKYIDRHLKKETFIIFLVSLAIIFGNAYLILVNHDGSFSADEKSYLLMANGNFDVSVTHRYRIIIPLLARLLSEIFNIVLELLKLKPPGSGLPLGISFLIINSLVMALASVVIYKIVSLTRVSGSSKFMALLGVITSGFCTYITGLALVDSLYFLCLVLLFYAVISQNGKALFFCLVIGPLAKESFWLFLPFILLFSRFVPFWTLVLFLLLGAGMLIGTNLLVDYVYGIAESPRISGAILHLSMAIGMLKNLFTAAGLLKLFSVFGLFNFFLLLGWFYSKSEIQWAHPWMVTSVVFLLIVMAHILLSGDLNRMWFLSAPAFALGLAYSFEKLTSLIILDPFNKHKNQ